MGLSFIHPFLGLNVSSMRMKWFFVKAFDQVYDYQLILHIELEDYLEDLKHGI